MASLEFAANRAVNHVGLRGQARQDGRNQTGISFVGDLGVGTEFLLGERQQTVLSKQFKAQTLRADARDFLIPAAGMTRNGDQRHVTSSS